MNADDLHAAVPYNLQKHNIKALASWSRLKVRIYSCLRRPAKSQLIYHCPVSIIAINAFLLVLY